MEELEPQQLQDQQLLKIDNQHLGWELQEVDQLIRLISQISMKPMLVWEVMVQVLKYWTYHLDQEE
jgi:hypothetical protein